MSSRSSKFQLYPVAEQQCDGADNKFGCKPEYDGEYKDYDYWGYYPEGYREEEVNAGAYW